MGHLHQAGEHAHDHHSAADAQQHPEEATVTVEAIASGFDPNRWRVESAQEHTRTVEVADGRSTTLRDAVVIASRLR